MPRENENVPEPEYVDRVLGQIAAECGQNYQPDRLKQAETELCNRYETRGWKLRFTLDKKANTAIYKDTPEEQIAVERLNDKIFVFVKEKRN